MSVHIKPINTGSLTCIACSLVFKDAELHRQHYGSDWHCYNLKRIAAKLPSVRFEEFQHKLTQFQQSQYPRKPDPVYCDACKKCFSNQNSFDNHLSSKKHNSNLKLQESLKDHEGSREVSTKPVSAEPESSTKSKSPVEAEEVDTDSEVEEVDSDEWEDDVENPIDDNNCIFCLHHSESFEDNFQHMTIVHSFFIPDAEFCVDVEGLMWYLGEKVSKYQMCLWCNEKGKTFHSADAARNHMKDKGHSMMLYEGTALAEYVEFYDYSSSYPDANEANPDEEVDDATIQSSEYELVLPSGLRIGHRQLLRYYKQRPKPCSAVVVSNDKKKKDKKLHHMLATYRGMGWTETQQEAAAKRARDIHAMKRLQSKLMLKLNMKANKFQKNFRNQINF